MLVKELQTIFDSSVDVQQSITHLVVATKLHQLEASVQNLPSSTWRDVTASVMAQAPTLM